MPRSRPSRFSPRRLASIEESTILRIRAGARTDHRFIGIWSAVIEGRVFVRSWGLNEGGWYRTFMADPLGTIQLGGREVKIRAVPVRSERLRDAVEHAFAARYSSPGSKMFVKGFRTKRRREATLELVPR